MCFENAANAPSIALSVRYMATIVSRMHTDKLSSERSRSPFAVARPSVVCLSVTLVRPTQAVEIFGNISMAFGTLAIR